MPVYGYAWAVIMNSQIYALSSKRLVYKADAEVGLAYLCFNHQSAQLLKMNHFKIFTKKI